MTVSDPSLTLKEYVFKIHRDLESVQEYWRWDFSPYIREVVASSEALQREFGDKYDTYHAAVILELCDIGESVDALRDDVNYGFSLIAEQLEFQNEQLTTMARTLANLYEVTLRRKYFDARQDFARGCKFWSEGLLREAVESFKEADKVYRFDPLTHFQLGKLYLIGKNQTDDVIDLEQAVLHLELAVRYGEAAIKREPKMKKFTAEALFLLSLAYYKQAKES
jgi:hypothetical protein